MTVIVFRDGTIAADSQTNVESESGGIRKFRCEKLFRKKTKDGAEIIIATAGHSSSGMVFVDWYGSGKKPPRVLLDNEPDFTCLVLKKDGLWEYDSYCRGEKITEEFYAIGCGAKAALGAMHMGATAEQAVEITCKIDQFCSPPIVAMRLSDE